MEFQNFCKSLKTVSARFERLLPHNGEYYEVLYFNMFGIQPGRRAVRWNRPSSPVRSGAAALNGLSRFLATLGSESVARDRSKCGMSWIEWLMTWFSWRYKPANVDAGAKFDEFCNSLKNVSGHLERLFPNQGRFYDRLFFGIFNVEPQGGERPRGWEGAGAVRSGNVTLGGVGAFLETLER